MMQANGNGGYFDHQRSPPLPRYSDYDGSHYGTSHYDGSHDSMESGRRSDLGWNLKQPESLSVGEFDAFDFHQTPMNDLGFYDNQQTPRDERKSLNLNTHVNTHIRPHNPDEVGRHLLYETALLDTQTYEILSIDEVDSLKKEQDRLNSKIEAAQRKLALESKVRNAAQNLQRLYSTNKRPDTPQSPDSPRKHSLLPGGRGRNNSNGKPETFQQADQELASSVKKVDELHEQVADLLTRRQDVERKLLRHTAAVLAEEVNRQTESGVPGMMNGHHFDDDNDSAFGHAYSDFDGIRDILHGRPAGTSTTSHQQEEQLTQMQEKLEQLNSQLRNIISEAGQTLGRTPAAEVGLDQSEDSSARLENRFARLERNLHTLEQQNREIKAVDEQHVQVLQQQEQDLKSVEEQFERADRDLQAKVDEIEEHLEGVNGQLHNALLQASDGQPIAGLQEPPRAGEHGYQEQLQYMEDSLLTMEQLLQQRSQADDLLDVQTKVEDLKKKTEEYEAVVGGLWDILQSENATSPRPDQEGDDREPASPLKETFSLQAFNNRVQSLFERVQSAREQQDILRRQIQQQRELGGKSDMEKEQQIADIQGRHDKLSEEHGTVQRELSNYMMKHEQASNEVEQSRSELTKVTEEIEELKRTVEKQQKERDEMVEQAKEMEEDIKDLEAQLDAQDDKDDAKHADLESEVVRLTTELTMAKAELDGAYGTRAERAGAQAAEVESLNEKNRELGEKHQDLTSRHDAVTAELESLDEKNRELEETHQDLITRHDAVTAELESLRAEVETLRPNANNKSGEHVAQLERELQEMTNEFQELTKESIALEREREQLDGLIDTLRDRCDELESQLSDEKLQRTASREEDGQREQRHMLVLKQEFKKMMREQKAEGVKVLRAEQEERRRLETELRKMRQASGPLAKSLTNGVNGLNEVRDDGATSPGPA